MVSKIFSKNFSKFIFEIYDDKPHFPFIEIHQIHSNILVELEKYGEKADGFIGPLSALEKSPLVIKTADCLPIILWNEEDISFLHAGWKGLSLNIIENINFIPTHAFIGPSISRESFEVTSEFSQYFKDHPLVKNEDKLYFDLQKEATKRIKKLNPNAIVEDSNICTFKNLAYNSYRRDKTEKRNYNVIKHKGIL